MAHNARLTVFGEVQQRLTQLGLSRDVRDHVMDIVRRGIDKDEPGEARSGRFAILVARMFNRTALRATTTLGSASFSMLIMLFDLFVAHEQGRTVSVSSLCIASGAASTTALRQINQMEERGLVSRREDELDRRRTFVAPTPLALDLIRTLMDDWATVLR